MSKHLVCATSDIKDGGSKVVTIKGREIVVFKVKDRYYALLNRCPHEGASLCTGALVGKVSSPQAGQYVYERPGELLRCPWHGWEFDLVTGQSYCHPNDIKVRTFAIEVEPGAEIVKGPLVAETFPVSIDKQYVFVEV